MPSDLERAAKAEDICAGLQGYPSVPADLTDDAFLGGQVRLLQPRSGYRAGLDAVLLAAAVARSTCVEPRRLLDAGAGVGTVGLCVASRLKDRNVTLVEIQEPFVELARQNIDRNALHSCVDVVHADVTAKAATLSKADLEIASFHDVVMNPPYQYAGSGTPCSEPDKEMAHAMTPAQLEHWVRFAVRMLRPGGRVYMINRTAVLPDVVVGFAGRFGSITVKPIQPYAGQAASRVLITAVKGSRGPFHLAPPLMLHQPTSEPGLRRAFQPDVQAILRDGSGMVDWFPTKL